METKKKMKTFDVTGSFIERGEEKKFRKTVNAFNSNNATEKTLSLFGSKHRIKRNAIAINEVKEVEGQ